MARERDSLSGEGMLRGVINAPLMWRLVGTRRVETNSVASVKPRAVIPDFYAPRDDLLIYLRRL